MPIGLRWIELHEYKSKSSEEISLIFDREWLCRYAHPKMVIFDSGTEFSSEFYELLHSYRIQPKATTIKNPQSNAIVERLHLTISNSLRAMHLFSRSTDNTSIHGILHSIAWALRTTFHTALRTSPGQLAFGRDMIIPATYLANWHDITSRRKNILYRFGCVVRSMGFLSVRRLLLGVLQRRRFMPLMNARKIYFMSVTFLTIYTFSTLTLPLRLFYTMTMPPAFNGQATCLPKVSAISSCAKTPSERAFNQEL